MSKKKNMGVPLRKASGSGSTLQSSAKKRKDLRCDPSRGYVHLRNVKPAHNEECLVALGDGPSAVVAFWNAEEKQWEGGVVMNHWTSVQSSCPWWMRLPVVPKATVAKSKKS